MKNPILLAIALGPLAASASEPCSLEMLLGKRELEAFAKQPDLPGRPIQGIQGLEQVELFCPTQSIASDVFGYSAFINPRENVAYIYQYGGYFGVSNWYGPVPVGQAVAEQCIRTRRAGCAAPVVYRDTR